MAQTSTINAILGNLITSVTGRSSKTHAREHKSMRESALKTIKTQQYVRVNQFEVEASVSGLVEKFSVLNRDDLADALKARIEELTQASRSKWTPEILSLFLSLSDRPVDKSNVDALQLLRPPTPPDSPLTWDEIIADDPLTGDIWDEISYSAGSSDDDVVTSRAKGSSRLVNSNLRSEGHDTEQDLEKTSIYTTPTKTLLEEIQQAQFWKAQHTSGAGIATTRTQKISELQTVREVALMLHGLPTALFGIDEDHSIIFYSADIGLADVSNSSLNDTLQAFANIGSDIFRLRAWVRRPQTTPLLQAFHFSVISRLRQFDNDVANIERDFVATSGSVMISLMKLHQQIRRMSRALLHLGQLVDRVPTQGSGFACLELLYDEISLLQAAGDLESYGVLAHIFFDCLKIYLRPVRRWIETGELGEQDDSFFVVEAEKDCALSSLWQDRFILRMTSDGELYAPTFLEPAGRKILNAGKSIDFLRQLSLLDKVPPTLTEPPLGFDEISESASPLALAPFSELFSVALDDWVRSKYGPASSILCHQLFSHCSLGLYMDALEHLYFSKDGIRFQTLADELFRRMDDRQKTIWNDRFLLSELAREVFGNLPGIEEDRIGVRTMQVKGSERSVKALSSIAIDLSLPWPILNIIQRSSLPTYQRVLRLLLQIYRAKYLLRRDSVNLSQPGTTDDTNRRSHFVRQRLVWFVDIMFSYVIETVIQPTTAEMRARLSEADDIDTMISVHETFIAKLQPLCLLSKNLAPIHDTLISLIDLAVAYTDNQSRRLNRQTAKSRFESADRRRRRSALARELLDDVSSDEDEVDEDDDYDADNETPTSRNESFEETLGKIQEQFGQLLGFAVAGLKGVSRVGGEAAWEMLAERLDWGLSRVKT